MMPDSTNNRVVLFDATTGALVNSNYFAIPSGTTPIHAMQVGNEIWISEQLGDKVSRYDLTGTPLGAIGPTFPGGGLDNIRGMGLINNTVYVTNSGTANGAPGANAVATFSTSGSFLGSFQTTGTAPSPFGILAHGSGMLISSSSGNDDIHRFDLAGVPQGTFFNSTTLSFFEQMDHATNGDVIAAVFTTGNISRFDPTTGALISSFPASGARGVFHLANGNIMWTSGSGVFVYDGVSSTSVYSGAGRYLDFLQLTPIPEPSSIALVSLVGMGGLIWRRVGR